MNLTAHSRRADPTNGRANRTDLVAERFRLFNSTNVSPISQVFGSGLTPFPDLGNRLPEPGPAKSRSLWASSFEKPQQEDCDRECSQV
jgi:hypothetical protein